MCGVDDSGNFVTSAAKEYPSSMCCAVAKAIHDTVRASFRPEIVATEGTAAEVDERERFYCIAKSLKVPFDVYTAAGEIGADFNAGAAKASSNSADPSYMQAVQAGGYTNML